MSFVDEIDKDGRILWWGVELSVDNFATVSYRWGTEAGTVDIAGTPRFFEQRLLDVSTLQRSLGNDHLPVASTVTLVLDNTDFLADFLCDHATAETTTFAARFRLYLGLGETGATMFTKQIGNFVCFQLPTRDDAKVTLSLADDVMGRLSDLIVPPSPYDWFKGVVDGTLSPSETPFDVAGADVQLVPLIDWRMAVALQFGVAYPGGPTAGSAIELGALSLSSSAFIGYPLCIFSGTRSRADFDLANWPAGRSPNIYPIMLLATTDQNPLEADDVVDMIGFYNSDVVGAPSYAGQSVHLPETFSLVGTTFRIWKAYKTEPIATTGPDGAEYDFCLVWIALDLGAVALWMTGLQAPATVATNPLIPLSPAYPATIGPIVSFPLLTNAQCNAMFAAFHHFEVTGAPGSQVNGRLDSGRWGNPIDILQDLVEQYSTLGAGSFDATRAARARLQARNRMRGSITPDGSPQTSDQSFRTNTTPYGMGTLRKAIADIASSADVDLFVQMDGKVGVVTQGADLETQTSTYPTIQETRTSEVLEKIPSTGQRWTPYNRVFVQGANGLTGPFDNAEAIQAWKRIVPKVIQSKWWQDFNMNATFFINPNTGIEATSQVWAMRYLESKVRPVIAFMTDVAILALELGDYFLMSVSRGGVSPRYTLALWKLDGVALTKRGSVSVTAVWCGDLQTDKPFLLDDETLVVRAANGGATLTVTTGSTTVVRSAGSFIIAGLAAGDVILMRDSSEALTALTRNRQIKVVSITDATHAVVADSAFGAAGAHVIAAADWTMQRSYLTYPTAVSDPTNYPLGSTAYGKVSNSSGLFSDATQANKL